MIEVQHIEKNFGKLQVLKDVSFDIEKGGIYAVLGPNGSGKTTILKILLGMVLPKGGTIHFDGEQILGAWRYRNKISYLPQIAQFPDNLTVKELIGMIRDVRNSESHESDLIELFGLEASLNKRLGALSGGTRQKVNLVLTFMFDAPVYILDEPTAGLDPVSLLRLKELISKEKEKGKIILITTHILSLVEELADEIIFLLEGKIHFKGEVSALEARTGQRNLEHAIADILADV